jgi:hypothetical protein
MRIAEPLGQSVFKDPLDIIQGKDDELSRRLMKLNEREKRYHNDVFTDIRRDEAFMKSYSRPD